MEVSLQKKKDSLELLRRSSGLLLHISSLPGKYGIGTLGKEAFDFIDYRDNIGCGLCIAGDIN